MGDPRLGNAPRARGWSVLGILGAFAVALALPAGAVLPAHAAAPEATALRAAVRGAPLASSSAPAPPPAPAHALCCDGSASPTCGCGGGRGCCSHHHGVCGCAP